MTDKLERPLEELVAGDEFRKTLLPRADDHRDDAPMFFGWAIMDAFLAGIDYERKAAAAQLATIRAETVEECVQKAIQTLFEEGFNPGLQKVVGRALRSLWHAEPQQHG